MHSPDTLFAQEHFTSVIQVMQANLVKSLYFTLICFFSHQSTTIIIVTILFFLMLYAA